MNNKKGSQKEKGLYGKYNLSKSNGKPLDVNSKYFVLRYDDFGDHCHVEASRKALLVYADEIEPFIPQLAKDIREDVK